jgi:hypothetical protein
MRRRSEAKPTETVNVPVTPEAPEPTPPAPPAEGSAYAPERNRDAMGLSKPVGASLPAEFDRIVERTFIVDVHGTYERLEAALHVGEQRGDYVTVNKAVDEAEMNAREAFRLYLTGRIEVARFEVDADKVKAPMWEAATRELQREKDSGRRSKQITDADVKAMAAQMFADEWTAYESKTAKAKAMVDSLKDLADRWSGRCESLRAMLKALRK